MKAVTVWTRGILIVLLATSALRAGADPGDRKMLGKAGEWKNTVVGAVMKNQLYTIETDGTLYATNLTTGAWKPVGKQTFKKPRFLLSSGPSLYAVLGDNSLYRVNPSTGVKKRLGGAGVWKNVIKATTLNGQLYSVTAKGGLYRTNMTTGKWQQIGKTEFGATTVIAGHEKAQYSPLGLFTIEKDGSLYSVNPANGTWKLLGKNGNWNNSKAGVILSDTDMLYTVNSQGQLKCAMLSGKDAPPYVMGKPLYKRTTQLFLSADKKLFALDADGSLYAVEMEPLVG